MNALVVLGIWIIAMASGLFSGWVASKNGKSIFIWFLIGALLPIVGVAIALFIKEERKKRIQ